MSRATSEQGATLRYATGACTGAFAWWPLVDTKYWLAYNAGVWGSFGG